MTATNLLLPYVHLIRLHKPVGTLLLLWPTLWGLWLASGGVPPTNILLIFIAGTFLMRSAGCAINDFADRNVDGRVARTRTRPLAQGTVTPVAALVVAASLGLLAFLLVLQCNTLTILLAFIGAAVAAIYPFLKRVTHLPQLGLGVAFSWGVPMAFAAVNNTVSWQAWFLFGACVLWPVIFDTLYAMVDREDDVIVGIKSTAILFAQHDRSVVALLQITLIAMLMIVGALFQLTNIYYFNLLLAAVLFVYQQWLIKDRQREQCMHAFLNNNWVGLAIFVGIALSLLP